MLSPIKHKSVKLKNVILSAVPYEHLYVLPAVLDGIIIFMKHCLFNIYI